MKDKTGRPKVARSGDSHTHDLEKGSVFIPNNYITTRMIDSDAIALHDGTEVGRYGIGKYGRCLYAPAGAKGIYGYNTYGNARYW